MKERYFKREVILHLITNINSDDFKEFLASEYMYLAVRDTKKKKSAVISVNGRTISVITITNNVIRCNNYNDTVITNIN